VRAQGLAVTAMLAAVAFLVMRDGCGADPAVAGRAMPDL